MNITRAYIGMGSNLGDRAGNLLLGVRGMMNAGLRVIRLSSIYETAPVDVPGDQPSFLNLVAELDVTNPDPDDGASGPTPATVPSPAQLLARLLRIEYALGRRRDTGPGAARTLDLDLLLYGDEKVETAFLILPHPRLHLRRFVLTPLAELAPDTLHPTQHKSFRQLLTNLDDHSFVVRWLPEEAKKVAE